MGKKLTKQNHYLVPKGNYEYDVLSNMYID